MSLTPAAPDAKSAQPFIKRDAAGRPFIEAHRCRACGAAMVETLLACPACAARDSFDAFEASGEGVLHAFSIVRRSFPGVATPFISAVVDLSDGVTLKGDLIDVEPTPEAIRPGMPVRLVFGDALGRTDKDGASYLAFFFQPAV